MYAVDGDTGLFIDVLPEGKDPVGIVEFARIDDHGTDIPWIIGGRGHLGGSGANGVDPDIAGVGDPCIPSLGCSAQKAGDIRFHRTGTGNFEDDILVVGISHGCPCVLVLGTEQDCDVGVPGKGDDRRNGVCDGDHAGDGDGGAVAAVGKGVGNFVHTGNGSVHFSDVCAIEFDCGIGCAGKGLACLVFDFGEIVCVGCTDFVGNVFVTD